MHGLPVLVSYTSSNLTLPPFPAMPLKAQALVEITLEALEHIHVSRVPAVLMLQWFLARAPHLKALLLREGVLAKMFARMSRIEAQNGEGESGVMNGKRSIQYSALALVIGALFS